MNAARLLKLEAEATVANNPRALGIVAVLKLISPRGDELAGKEDNMTEAEHEELGLLCDIVDLITHRMLPLRHEERVHLNALLQAQRPNRPVQPEA